MPPVIAARGQMAVSLAFHIVWASFGVGLPFMMLIAEWIGMRRRDLNWYRLAKRWAKAFGIMYAIGAVSGTVLSFELGLLWPRFMRFAGPIFGLPFFIEATAFFIEAIFLGIYLYSWDKLSPFVHWLTNIPLVLGGLASSLFVVTANAWMNTPTGFRIVNGKVTDIDPIQAMLSPSAPMEAFHMTLAAYEATAFSVAAVYAFAWLRGKRVQYVRNGLLLSMILGLITAPLQIWVGDVTAKMVAQTQPAKLAAMEGLFQTTRYAPLTIYGWPDPTTGRVYFSVDIKDLLSLLAYDDIAHPVRGLDSFPGFLRPDTQIIHPLFDTMVGIGFLIAFISLWFWFRFFRTGRTIPGSRWLLWGIVASGPLAFLAIEFGWAVTELGRQPYIVYGYMYVADGVQTAPGLDTSFPIFFILYLLLGFASVFFLLRLAREQHEVPTPRVDIGEIIPTPEQQVDVAGGHA
jgi:cytochrome d ubiquinol oxidase subunit I